jgi:hypothetical protein
METIELGLEMTTKQTSKSTEKKIITKSSKKVTSTVSRNGTRKPFKKILHQTRLANKRLLIKRKHQFINVGQYTDWLKNPINANKLKKSTEKNAKDLRYNLSLVMGKDYDKYVRNEASQAHHIVGRDGRYGSSQISQDILDRFEININDPMNGILLPPNSASALKGQNHFGGHPKDYNDIVAQALQSAKTKEQCYEVLDRLKNDVYNCKLLLYNTPKKNTVINSFK